MGKSRPSRAVDESDGGGADGTPIPFSRDDFGTAAGCGTVNFTFTVAGNGDAMGAYSFRLLDQTSATAFTPGSPVNGTLASPGTEADL